MTTVVTGPGNFTLQEDIKGNLSIVGNDITVVGRGCTVHGWLHICGNNIKVSKLILKPRQIFPLDAKGRCKVCASQSTPCDEQEDTVCNEACYTLVHNCDTVELDDIIIFPPQPLSTFACVDANSTVEFINCSFYGNVFNDPPESEYVIRKNANGE